MGEPPLCPNHRRQLTRRLLANTHSRSNGSRGARLFLNLRYQVRHAPEHAFRCRRALDLPLTSDSTQTQAAQRLTHATVRPDRTAYQLYSNYSFHRRVKQQALPGAL
jgi:hypothetical protein